jgi:hypothetical protein
MKHAGEKKRFATLSLGIKTNSELTAPQHNDGEKKSLQTMLNTRDHSRDIIVTRELKPS